MWLHPPRHPLSRHCLCCCLFSKHHYALKDLCKKLPAATRCAASAVCMPPPPMKPCKSVSDPEIAGSWWLWVGLSLSSSQFFYCHPRVLLEWLRPCLSRLPSFPVAHCLALFSLAPLCDRLLGTKRQTKCHTLEGQVWRQAAAGFLDVREVWSQ